MSLRTPCHTSCHTVCLSHTTLPHPSMPCPAPSCPALPCPAFHLISLRCHCMAVRLCRPACVCHCGQRHPAAAGHHLLGHNQAGGGGAGGDRWVGGRDGGGGVARVGTSGTVQIGGRVHGRVPLGGPQATWLKLEPPSVVREECFQDAGCFKAP